MATTRLRVITWAGRAEGRESRAEWAAWTTGPVPQEVETPAAGMPPMLRRRLGPLGQRAIAAAYEAGASRDARYIFASRHGDLRRTAALLAAIAASEPLSPAEFSVSVHNAFAGLLSIAVGATAGHSAIAAGADSFACGLVEALGCLATAPAEPVLLVFYDEEPPSPYDELGTATGESLALALLLAADADGDGERIELAVTPGSGTVATTQQAFDCVRFLASREPVQRSIGGRADLEWRRAG